MVKPREYRTAEILCVLLVSIAFFYVPVCNAATTAAPAAGTTAAAAGGADAGYSTTNSSGGNDTTTTLPQSTTGADESNTVPFFMQPYFIVPIVGIIVCLILLFTYLGIRAFFMAKCPTCCPDDDPDPEPKKKKKKPITETFDGNKDWIDHPPDWMKTEEETKDPKQWMKQPPSWMRLDPKLYDIPSTSSSSNGPPRMEP